MSTHNAASPARGLATLCDWSVALAPLLFAGACFIPKSLTIAAQAAPVVAVVTPAQPDAPSPPPPPAQATVATTAPPPMPAGPAGAPPPAGGVAATAQVTVAAAPAGADGTVEITEQPQGDAPPNVESFYEPLRSYGTWGSHGTYSMAWSPMDATYEPYRNGYWQTSSFGWLWVASEPFGWAVNHYGRWFWDGRWYWVPDTTWGPSWVEWRASGEYIGWAPAMPAGAAESPQSRWRFIASMDMGRVDLASMYVNVDTGYAGSQPLERYTHTPGGDRFVAGPDPVVLHESYYVDITPPTLEVSLTGRYTADEWRDPGTIERRRQEADVRRQEVYRRQLVSQQQWRSSHPQLTRPIPTATRVTTTTRVTPTGTRVTTTTTRPTPTAGARVTPTTTRPTTTGTHPPVPPPRPTTPPPVRKPPPPPPPKKK